MVTITTCVGVFVFASCVTVVADDEHREGCLSWCVIWGRLMTGCMFENILEHPVDGDQRAVERNGRRPSKSQSNLSSVYRYIHRCTVGHLCVSVGRRVTTADGRERTSNY